MVIVIGDNRVLLAKEVLHPCLSLCELVLVSFREKRPPCLEAMSKAIICKRWRYLKGKKGGEWAPRMDIQVSPGGINNYLPHLDGRAGTQGYEEPTYAAGLAEQRGLPTHHTSRLAQVPTPLRRSLFEPDNIREGVSLKYIYDMGGLPGLETKLRTSIRVLADSHRVESMGNGMTLIKESKFTGPTSLS